MERLKRVFAILCIEIVLVGILGYMTLDNNYCDQANSWHWSYMASNNSLSLPACPVYNISVQSTQSRFYALMAVLAVIPVTVLYGCVVLYISAAQQNKHTR